MPIMQSFREYLQDGFIAESFANRTCTKDVLSTSRDCCYCLNWTVT